MIARIKEFMSDTSNRGRVLFVLMTNRPDKIDIDLKRAGRLDRKIPFFYAQTTGEVRADPQGAASQKQGVERADFPIKGDGLAPIVGMSNADIEAVVLLASDYASQRAESLGLKKRRSASMICCELRDYLPPPPTWRCWSLWSFWRCLGRPTVACCRPKYADLPIEALGATPIGSNLWLVIVAKP